MSQWRSMAFTTGGPMVRLGTKWPSITSTWRRSVSGATVSIAAASAAKSAERIDGAMRTIGVTLPGGPKRQEVHPVGAGVLGKQAGTPSDGPPRCTRWVDGHELGVTLRQPLVDVHSLMLSKCAY